MLMYWTEKGSSIYKVPLIYRVNYFLSRKCLLTCDYSLLPYYPNLLVVRRWGYPTN